MIMQIGYYILPTADVNNAKTNFDEWENLISLGPHAHCIIDLLCAYYVRGSNENVIIVSVSYVEINKVLCFESRYYT